MLESGDANGCQVERWSLSSRKLGPFSDLKQNVTCTYRLPIPLRDRIIERPDVTISDFGFQNTLSIGS